MTAAVPAVMWLVFLLLPPLAAASSSSFRFLLTPTGISSGVMLQVEAELRKKKGGKGLSILSGKELFAYNQELFVDDEEVPTPASMPCKHTPQAYPPS